MNKVNKITFLTKNLFSKHQSFILLSLLVLNLPIFLSYIPYVNLGYTFYRAVFVYFLIVVILISTPVKFLLILGIVLLFLTLIATMLGFAILAEKFGTLIFLFIAIKVFLLVVEYFKEKNNG